MRRCRADDEGVEDYVYGLNGRCEKLVFANLDRPVDPRVFDGLGLLSIRTLKDGEVYKNVLQTLPSSKRISTSAILR